MVYESIVEKLFDENNDDIIELQQGSGKVVKFEQVAVVIYNSQYYAILHPLELKEDEVVIFRIIEEDEDSLDLVTDEELSKKILEVYAEDVNEDN
ncbi:MAG: DUF1292 domain-containing protein [Bacteroidales bacterium]|nr:DUF1292 domain-containing protein [Bacteroidales bacterium]